MLSRRVLTVVDPDPHLYVEVSVPTIFRMILVAACAVSWQAGASAQSDPSPAWVARSNTYARPLIDALAITRAEDATLIGLAEYDAWVTDLNPDRDARFRAALRKVKAELEVQLTAEQDPDVRSDLQLMISGAGGLIASSEANEAAFLPWVDVPKLVFKGISALLSPQIPAARRQVALRRLERYAGMTTDTTPITVAARQRYEARASQVALLRPTRLEIEQAIFSVDHYRAGIRDLFARYGGDDARPALDTIDAQLRAYAEWARAIVLPAARDAIALPPELYALRLQEAGIDIGADELMQLGQQAFVETRAELERLAPTVAEAKHFAVSDYRDVIRLLKADTLSSDRLEREYRRVIAELDAIIAREHIVARPARPLVMRLASVAESAEEPAPRYLPGPLPATADQLGQFVLPEGYPSPAGEDDCYDDFNHPAALWTLSAHEGRPGHDTQLTAAAGSGVSLARSVLSYNDVSTEGWALYAEAEVRPYEPIEAQLIALQLRLLRAARALLDPMLNLGLIDRDSAAELLQHDVGLSKALTRQELDRYTFGAPGHAGAYLYGYSRILQLRAEAELALGDAFDRLAFNDFVVTRGLLPPALLARAVREQFIPSARGLCQPSGQPPRAADAHQR